MTDLNRQERDALAACELAWPALATREDTEFAERMEVRDILARGDTERPDDEEPPQWTLVWEPDSGWTVAEVRRAGALVARGERVAVTTVAKRPEFLPVRVTEQEPER